MTHQTKDRVLLASLVVAVAIVLVYGYSYIFLDIKIKSVIASNQAPKDYKGLSLQQPTQILKLFHENEDDVIIQLPTLETWVEPFNRDYTQTDGIRPKLEIINSYLAKLALKLDKPAVNARLDYKDGEIIAFDFPTKGKVLNISKSSRNIASALANGIDQAELVFDEVDPQITLEQIDNMGIKKLLGRGESDFGNSSQARITNIKVASRLFNDYLLKPGEEFSFNKILGDVDAVNGYLPELVIKNNSLIKEYGGGICQVSTTVFRAAILSGLRIVERRPHTLPVSYYNPQGFDATIYPGYTDLKFVNDTNNNILIQTSISGHKIYFDFYGNDDRKVTITPPIQYDVKKNGSMKTVFTRTIVDNDGQTKTEEFRSAYKSPLAFPTLRNPLE